MNCSALLNRQADAVTCAQCGSQWPVIDGIPSFVPNSVHDREFYESWHSDQAAKRRDDPLRKLARRMLRPVRYFVNKREMLFRETFDKRPKGPVFDLACGIGQPLYLEWGDVVGVDLSIRALRTCKARGTYADVIHADATQMRFLSDESFSSAVSADFFGHVPIPVKDGIISELHRILRKGGITAHVIETDSANAMFRFAHQHPELFQKHFIEEIGGHYGLEMPSEVVKRFERHGFRIVRVAKMWGPVWHTREYIRQFGNDYTRQSVALKAWIGLCRLMATNPVTLVGFDALLGVVSRTVDAATPLDNAQGIFLVAEKI